MTYKAFKYRLYPTKAQQVFLDKHFGCSRFVYNHFLALRKETWEKDKLAVSGFDCKKQLRSLKSEYLWLKEVNSQSLQESVLNLDKAYKRFFKKLANYPRFKKKGNKQSFAVPQHFSIETGRVNIPKLVDGIKFKQHRGLIGIPKSLTISKTPSAKYFVSIVCECEIEKLPPIKQEVGVDLGLTHFATLSTGEKIEHPKVLKRSARQLARLQRSLSRKQKGSNNRLKAKLLVARIHEKIANQRKDFLHKLSSRLINENQVICIEDLNVRGMVKNRCLAKAISDSGWSEVVRQLHYKSDWYGRTVKQIPRFYPSSKECNVCYFVYAGLTLSQRVWTCPNCGTIHDRDDNATKVIKRVGQDMPELTPVEKLAAVTPTLSMKQVSSKKQEAFASLKMHGV